MNTITTLHDLANWVYNTNPDNVCSVEGLDGRLVKALQRADHPEWGTDWSEWLDSEEVTGIVAEVIRVWREEKGMQPGQEGMTLMRPTVHLNGTSRDALESQFAEALEAVRAAIKALDAAGPSARDYYPQGDAAFGKARSEHTARVNAMQRVREELALLLESVGAESNLVTE